MKLTSYCLDTSQPFDRGSPKPSKAIMTWQGWVERPNLNPSKDFDWPAIPGYFGHPRFLAILGACYLMKDLVT